MNVFKKIEEAIDNGDSIILDDSEITSLVGLRMSELKTSIIKYLEENNHIDKTTRVNNLDSEYVLVDGVSHPLMWMRDVDFVA